MFFTADTALAGAAERPPWEQGEETVSCFPSDICLNLKLDDVDLKNSKRHTQKSSFPSASKVVDKTYLDSWSLARKPQPLLPSHCMVCKGGCV